MKLGVVSYLLILFFFLTAAATAAQSIVIDDASPDPVLDEYGNNLEAGVEYIIYSLRRGGGGGGVTFSQNESYCHREVVQELSVVINGTPVTFTPVDPKEGVIRVSTDLNIKFSNTSIDKSCPQSYVWKLQFNEISENYFIETGGVEGNPGLETLSNWFKIEKSNVTANSYKLSYCPSVCSLCKLICKDVGLQPEPIQSGSRRTRLVLSDTPFYVIFTKPIEQQQLESLGPYCLFPRILSNNELPLYHI